LAHDALSAFSEVAGEGGAQTTKRGEKPALRSAGNAGRDERATKKCQTLRASVFYPLFWTHLAFYCAQIRVFFGYPSDSLDSKFFVFYANFEIEASYKAGEFLGARIGHSGASLRPYTLGGNSWSFKS